jgi:hypothetical protein
MVMSENRTPLFGIMRAGEAIFFVRVVVGKARMQRGIARTLFCFVIAGLNPAIHAMRGLV